MLASLRTLFLATLAILMCSLVTWLYLRHHAYGKLLQDPVHHPFLAEMKEGHPLVISYAGEADFPDNTFEGFDAAVERNPDAALWADVRPASDGTLILYRDTDLSQTTDGKGWIGYTTLNDIQKANAGFAYQDAKGNHPFRDHPVRIPTLTAFLQRYPKQRLILNLLDNRPGLDDIVVKILDGAHAGPRVLIQSPEDGILRDLRDHKPDWLFGTSQARETQFKILDSIGLQALVSLKGDVYVTSVQIGQNQMLSESMRAELLRRKMPIFVGPVQDKTLAQKLVGERIDGIITKDVLVLVH